MSLTLVINGQSRTFADLVAPLMLDQVIRAMDLKGDRIAVEHNGEIAQRVRWAGVPVTSGDRLEIVHFVGGGINRGRAQCQRLGGSCRGSRDAGNGCENDLRIACREPVTPRQKSPFFPASDRDYT
jgi:sulfur carrier protein